MSARSPTPFVVLTSARTGSSWLVDTLSSHPQVAAWHELFIEQGHHVYGSEPPESYDAFLARLPPWARPVRLPWLAAYLRTVYGPRPGVRAAGFKLMYGHVVRNPGLLPCLSLARARAVHLVRANLLDAVVSYEVAQASGVFRTRRPDDKPAGPVSIDVTGLRERLEHMEWAVARGRSWLERFRLPRLEVAYEELVGRREETLARVLRFVGVDPDVGPLGSSLARQGAGGALDLVENADAVRAALAGTRFEWMLREPARAQSAYAVL